MGCGISKNPVNDKEVRMSTQPKTPILLFYLPGPVKATFFNLISPKIVSNGSNATSEINIRFNDAKIPRDTRRGWIGMLTDQTNYAAALYLADIRDHPTLLMTTKCLNWFVKGTFKTCPVKIVTIYSDKSQLEEFKGYLPEPADLIPIDENDSSTLGPLIDYLKSVEVRYNEARRNTRTTTRVQIM